MYLKQVSNIPVLLIVEVILCGIMINSLYSFIYFYMYKHDDGHFVHFFKETSNIGKKNKITFGDFFYFSNNLFFSMSSGVIPQSILSRIIVLSHIMIGFIFTAIFIGRIVAIPGFGA